MTPEFGAATQLEKIDMIDFADCIVINKFDKPGAEDALHAVRKQFQRSRLKFEMTPESIPVFGVVANRFNDSGTNWLYHKTIGMLIKKKSLNWKRKHKAEFAVSKLTELIPAEYELPLSLFVAFVLLLLAFCSIPLERMSHHLPRLTARQVLQVLSQDPIAASLPLL